MGIGPRSLSKYPLTVGSLLVLGFLIWLFRPGLEVTEAENFDEPMETVVSTSVQAIRVGRSHLSVRAEATGHLQPWREVEVSTEAAGKIVVRRVEEGQRVEAGSLLLQLDDRERQIELAEAQTEWIRSRAEHAIFVGSREEGAGPGTATSSDPLLVDEDSRRVQELFDQGLISAREMQRQRREQTQILAGARQSEVRAATTGLAQAEQQLERSLLALAKTRVEAPFSGRVADLEIEIGQQVAAGHPCLVLLDESKMMVNVDVLEADLVWLHPSAPALVRVPSLGDQSFSGSIHTINPRVNPETGTGRVTVVIDNPDGTLMPGLFALVELETRRLPDRLAVPADAVLFRQSRQLVFRLENERALWTYVETGARSNGLLEIASGLEEGDLVAVAGHFALAHEAPVTVDMLTAWAPTESRISIR